MLLSNAASSFNRWLFAEPDPLVFADGSRDAQVDWPPSDIASPVPAFVVHWHAPQWCVDTVCSLANCELVESVTVIDNGGLGEDAVAQFPEGTVVVRSPVNGGYTGGANQAITRWLRGSAEFAVLACHDVVVDRRAVRALMAAMDLPSVGISGMEHVRSHDPASPSPPAPVRITSVRWVSGACMLLRRACVEQIGLFDESFGSYVEDVDYSYRAIDRGWTVVSLPELRVGTQGRADPQASIAATANSLRLAMKRHGAVAVAAWTAKQVVSVGLAAFRRAPGAPAGRRERIAQRARIICLAYQRHVLERSR